MKRSPALLGACGILLLGASCAQPVKSGSVDASAWRRETLQDFEKKWMAEQKRQQRIADKEAAAKKRYYAEHIRRHGYPTHADRERAIREALKSAGASPGR
jgi:hypothetical protein